MIEPIAEAVTEAVPTRAMAEVTEPFADARTVLEEGLLADDDAAQGVADDARASLDRSWSELESAANDSGVRIDAGLHVVSVGTASKAGDRAVRLPVVLGNDAGESVTVALTISLDPLLDEESH